MLTRDIVLYFKHAAFPLGLWDFRDHFHMDFPGEISKFSQCPGCLLKAFDQQEHVVKAFDQQEHIFTFQFFFLINDSQINNLST